MKTHDHNQVKRGLLGRFIGASGMIRHRLCQWSGQLSEYEHRLDSLKSF